MLTSGEEKENDPTFGRLKRLSSITSFASPIGHLASRLRRPSTSLQPSAAENPGTGLKRTKFLARGSRQSSNTSSKSQLQANEDHPVLLHHPKGAQQAITTSIPRSMTTSNLLKLVQHEGPSVMPLNSQSSTDLPRKSRIPTPVAFKPTNGQKSWQRTREFSALRKISGSALPRFSTQPNLLTAARKPAMSETSGGWTHLGEEGTAKHSGFTVRTERSGTPQVKDDSTAFGASRERKSDVWQSPITQPHATSPQMVPTTKFTRSRKSIEQVYEDLHKSPIATSSEGVSAEVIPRRSLGGDITHRQLMAPLLPPLPRLPAGYTVHSPPSLSSACLVRQVTQRQTTAYWSGRYTSLNDCLMNEAIDNCPMSSNPLLPTNNSKEEGELARLAGAAHGVAHARRILDLLQAACRTDEALDSLHEWQKTFARLRQMPALASYAPKPPSPSADARALGRKRESLVLRALSGNAYGGPANNRFSEAKRDSRSGGAPVSETDKAAVMAVSGSSVDVGSDGRSGRKTSLIDRLLSSGRKASGKASALEMSK